MATKKLINSQLSRRLEKKYFLTAESATNMTYAGAVSDLSLIAQGDTDISRDGDSLYMRSCRIVGTMHNAGGDANHVRVILFQWHDDSTPTPSNVLIAGYLSTVNSVNSLYHHDQRKKYSVLWDKKIRLDPSGPTSAFFDSGYKFPKVKKISYTAGTTVGNNKLWLLIVSDTASATYPTVNYVAKLTYNDA